MDDERFMREAIRLAERAVVKGNQPFGAVLVRDGEIMLRAENTIHTERDFTGHAELNLARQAAQQFDAAFLSQCTVYASTEPCAMCAGAIYWSGIGRVVYGCSARRLYEIIGPGLDTPCQDILSRGARPVEVIGPLLEDEAIQIHHRYWHTSEE